MNRWIRDAGKGLIAFLAVTTLAGRSVLPVYADTADTKKEASGAGYTISNEAGYYALDYFDRVAVNSVKGALTFKPGDDFSISFPKGWEQVPYFAVQDEVLVVSGRKSAEQQAAESSKGSVVVLGEDEPAAGVENTGAASADLATDSTDADPTASAASDRNTDPADAESDGGQSDPAGAEADGGQSDPAGAEADGKQTGEMAPEIVITIPSGIGLDTLRIAMEEGQLIITDLTANAVTIQTGGGSVVMKDVSLGTVDIYADSGSLSMAECTFNSLNVGIADGSVNVSSKESLLRCRMEVKTDDGEVTFNGVSEGSQYLQPGNGKRFLVIQAGSGDINING